MGEELAKSTEAQVTALAKAGVRQVLWGNLFDVGKTPSLVAKVTLLGGAEAPTVLRSVSKAINAHNREMDAAIARLQVAWPELQIIQLDLHAKFSEVAVDPGKYGFADVSTGANDDRHLFSADGLHPTAKGHEMLAKFAYDTVTRPDGSGTVMADGSTAGLRSRRLRFGMPKHPVSGLARSGNGRVAVVIVCPCR
ncbi:SGNH/GDSL hydrolase family protein [Verrucomicrobium spinosum]|uniref:SGNH/GDSL hydrolase family protein n=1 Tax=Verrucomicrobium spinosum TaxID=2736 RepID=UPI0001744E05|nr:SGNH/GDSL hydrolase family protein [Verrucomicrobium spinosum]